MADLTQTRDVQEHMRAATTEDDWNKRCDDVKRANGGHYPSFWWEDINKSGLMASVVTNFR